VRAEHLGAAGGGAALWDPDEEWRDAERTIDEVTRRFGRGAVRPAALVRPGAPGPLPTAGAGWEREDDQERP
jgi:DNA polymerase-4